MIDGQKLWPCLYRQQRAAAFLWVGAHFYPSPQLNFTGVCLIYMPEPTLWSTFLWSLVAQWRHTFMIRSPSFRHTCTSTQMTNVSQWFNTVLSGLKYRHRTLWQTEATMTLAILEEVCLKVIMDRIHVSNYSKNALQQVFFFIMPTKDVFKGFPRYGLFLVPD